MHVGEELNMGEELPAFNRAEFLPAAGKPETGNSARKKTVADDVVLKNILRRVPAPLLPSLTETPL